MNRAGQMAGMGRAGANPDADAPTTAKYWLEAADALLASGRDLSALATGLVLNTAGVPSKATEGVHFSKGPWKLFSTVRNVAAAQSLSIPVVDGEGNGIVRATGRLLSDGTDRVISPKINGSATNMLYQEAFGSNIGAGADRGGVGSTGVYGCVFCLTMMTAKTANALKRTGFLWVCSLSATLANVFYSGAFHFKDSTTTITTIDLDCGNATGLAANSEALVEEGIQS
jgi:hypothetical protein